MPRWWWWWLRYWRWWVCARWGRRRYGWYRPRGLKPAYEQLIAGIQTAINAGREVRGLVHVGFVGAAAGQFVLQVADRFKSAYPECEVKIKESHVNDSFTPLRSGEIELLLTAFPVREPDLSTGSVLFREDRFLAVSARHPFARRASVTFDDLARDTVLRSPPGLPDYWDETIAPARTSDGRPTRRGPSFTTIQEMLTLIGAGVGIYPVPAQACQFYVRPDITYIPMPAAPPFEWGFVWRSAAETTRIRAFDKAARELLTTSVQDDQVERRRAIS